jgi:hypothetical protein
MIVEFGKDLQSLQSDVNRSLAVVAPLNKGIVENWEALHTLHHRAERTLLDMVEGKLTKLHVYQCSGFLRWKSIAVQLGISFTLLVALKAVFNIALR